MKSNLIVTIGHGDGTPLSAVLPHLWCGDVSKVLCLKENFQKNCSMGSPRQKLYKGSVCQAVSEQHQPSIATLLHFPLSSCHSLSTSTSMSHATFLSSRNYLSMVDINTVSLALRTKPKAEWVCESVLRCAHTWAQKDLHMPVYTHTHRDSVC